MSNIDKDKVEKSNNLRSKFLSRLNGDFFVSSGDEVSIYEVVKTLYDSYGFFNFCFFDKLEKAIQKINRSNGYHILGKNNNPLKRVGNIGFYVEEDGYYYCRVYYVDERGRVTGYTDVDNTIKVNASDEELNKNKKVFNDYLSYLDLFTTAYPGKSFRWDKLNPIAEVKELGDGFLSCKIDPYIYNMKQARMNFAKAEDSRIAGSLYEYIDMYNEEIMKKSSLNKEDLDPMIKEMINCKLEYNRLLEKIKSSKKF